MRKLLHRIRFLKGRRGGATAVGHALVVGLIGIAIIAALTATGDEIAALFQGTAGQIEAHAMTPDAPDDSNAPEDPTALQLGIATGDPDDMNVLAFDIPSTSDNVVFTVTNASLTDSEAPVTQLQNGSNFRIAGNACTDTLAPNESCAIAVQAVATGNGELTDLLRVSAGTQTQAVPLRGTATGFDGDIFLEQTPLEVVEGTCTPLIVSNQGYADLQALTLGPFEGPDAARFTACTPVAYACGDMLPAQQSCAFGIALTGDTPAESLTAAATVSALDITPRTRPVTGSTGNLNLP